MIPKNFEFLITNTLPNLGFAEVLDDALKTKMQLKQDNFNLKTYIEQGKKRIDYSLSFDKTDEMYYLNAIRATLTKENGEKVSNEFRLFKQRGFNEQEMLNMLEGRSVYRTFVS